MNLADLPGLTKVEAFESIKRDVKGFIIVDLSWILHKSYYAHGMLTANVGGVEVNTGDVYGTLKSLAALVNRKPFAAVILAIDGSTAKRKVLCPTYKGGRSDTDKANIYLKKLEILQAACLLPCVSFAYHPEYEADDLMGTMARAFDAAGFEVIVHTADKDLYQCIGGNIKQAKKLKGKTFEFIDEATVVAEMKVKPQELVVYRALKGDKSDNLPGYPRIPTKVVEHFSQQWSRPSDLLDLSDEDFKEYLKGLPATTFRTWAKKIRKDPQIFLTNFALMGLYDVGVPPIYRCQGSWTVLQKYQLQSIIDVFQRFLDEYAEAATA